LGCFKKEIENFIIECIMKVSEILSIYEKKKYFEVLECFRNIEDSEDIDDELINKEYELKSL
jgi:hypothetical protein